MSRFAEYITLAELMVSALRGKNRLMALRPKLRNLEKVRREAFADLHPWPGADLVPASNGGADEFTLRHPLIDDEAKTCWIYWDQTLTAEQETELKDNLVAIIQAWIDYAEYFQAKDAALQAARQTASNGKLVDEALHRVDEEQNLEHFVSWLGSQLAGVVDVFDDEKGLSFRYIEPSGVGGSVLAYRWERVGAGDIRVDGMPTIPKGVRIKPDGSIWRKADDNTANAKRIIKACLSRWLRELATTTEKNETVQEQTDNWKSNTTKGWANRFDLSVQAITLWHRENKPWIQKVCRGEYRINLDHPFIANKGWKQSPGKQ